MFDLLDKIRAKPERTRRAVLHSTMVVFGLLIALIWAGTIDDRFQDEQQQVVYEENTPVGTISQAFSGLSSEVGESFGTAASAIGAFGQAATSSSEQVEVIQERDEAQ